VENVGIIYVHLEYFTAIGHMARHHLIYFRVIWYIFPNFGMMYHKNLATRVCMLSTTDLSVTVTVSVAVIELKPQKSKWQFVMGTYSDQGCQIFLATTYKNGKIYQITTKCAIWS
jgi:hypothetical protein